MQKEVGAVHNKLRRKRSVKRLFPVGKACHHRDDSMSKMFNTTEHSLIRLCMSNIFDKFVDYRFSEPALYFFC
jgi:hypothetical protein